MISQSDSIQRVIEQWIDKGCIEPNVELICKSIVAIVKEQERTNLLLLELLNRTAGDKE